jgi:hypothetical protein
VIAASKSFSASVQFRCRIRRLARDISGPGFLGSISMAFSKSARAWSKLFFSLVDVTPNKQRRNRPGVQFQRGLCVGQRGVDLGAVGVHARAIDQRLHIVAGWRRWIFENGRATGLHLVRDAAVAILQVARVGRAS